MKHYQARFYAVVSHTPGLVYQCALQRDGRISFPYLSDGCAALLGMTPGELQLEPARFLALILEDDRAAYLASMQASASTMSNWNWEGRIHIEAWHDVKWISLRASPRRSGDVMLWDGIMTNITASKTEQLDAERTRLSLAELRSHSELAREQERARIARELHDDLGGNLTAIKMALAMLARRLPAEPAVLAEKAAYLDSLVDRTIDAVHRISRDLRPSTLDLGIVAALEWQASEFTERTGIACTAEIDPDIDLDDAQATALFRIFQEALTNIAKHAGASRVTVRLHCADATLQLSICDNGCGVETADRLKPASFGLRGMMERARALDGSLTLSVPPGGGTMVRISIPRAPSMPPDTTHE
jgi:two-component system sensor histidine kinase UhpB